MTDFTIDGEAQVQGLRALLHETVAAADALVGPVLAKISGCDPVDLTPQVRFNIFVEATSCLNERESGAGACFGLLCHAYALRQHMEAMGDDELMAAAARSWWLIVYTPGAWEGEPAPVELEMQGLAPCEALLRAFENALVSTKDWCETRLALMDMDDEKVQQLLEDDPDLQWWVRVQGIPEYGC